MRKLNGRQRKTLFLLSLVVPIGLITAFKLTNVLEGPAEITETITLNVAKWEFERPSVIFGFEDRIGCSYVGEISINQTIIVGTYRVPLYESPRLLLLLNLTADLTEGYVENVNITFHDDHLNSQVEIRDLEFDGKHVCAVWDNLTATAYAEGPWWGVGSVEKAFVSLKGVNHPRGVYLYILPEWVLGSPNNQTQQLNVRVEVTYFNGTVYKKVVQPFQLKLTAETNTNFENAEAISSGQSYSSFLGGDNLEDFYKVYLMKDEIVNITMTPPAGVDFDLYLYNPADRSNPVANSTHRGDILESVEYMADAAGWWFIKVQWNGGWGIYTLNATILSIEGTQ